MAVSHSAFPIVTKRPIGLRLAEALTGHSFKVAEEWLVDRFVYTLVIGYFVNLYGPVVGGLYGLAVMFPVTAVLCYLYIWCYNTLKRDLFGFELLKELKDETMSNGWIGILKIIARQSDIFAFFILSAWKDAFMTTLYLKREAFKPLTPRDHKIFWASLFVSNAWWAFLLTGVTSIAFFVIELPVVWYIRDVFVNSSVYLIDSFYTNWYWWLYLLFWTSLTIVCIRIQSRRKNK